MNNSTSSSSASASSSTSREGTSARSKTEGRDQDVAAAMDAFAKRVNSCATSMSDLVLPPPTTSSYLGIHPSILFQRPLPTLASLLPSYSMESSSQASSSRSIRPRPALTESHNGEQQGDSVAKDSFSKFVPYSVFVNRINKNSNGISFSGIKLPPMSPPSDSTPRIAGEPQDELVGDKRKKKNSDEEAPSEGKKARTDKCAVIENGHATGSHPRTHHKRRISCAACGCRAALKACPKRMCIDCCPRDGAICPSHLTKTRAKDLANSLTDLTAISTTGPESRSAMNSTSVVMPASIATRPPAVGASVAGDRWKFVASGEQLQRATAQQKHAPQQHAQDLMLLSHVAAGQLSQVSKQETNSSPMRPEFPQPETMLVSSCSYAPSSPYSEDHGVPAESPPPKESAQTKKHTNPNTNPNPFEALPLATLGHFNDFCVELLAKVTSSEERVKRLSEDMDGMKKLLAQLLDYHQPQHQHYGQHQSRHHHPPPQAQSLSSPMFASPDPEVATHGTRRCREDPRPNTRHQIQQPRGRNGTTWFGSAI
jgi:hypothetical protein